MACAACSVWYAEEVLSAPIVLDDAFLYLRTVERLVATGKPELNPGDDRLIVTSPLWTAVLALAHALLPSIHLQEVTRALWYFFLALASILAHLVFRESSPVASQLVPIPFFLSAMVMTMMGTEVALLYAALFWTVLSHTRRAPLATGIGLGAAYLARGEMVLLSVPIALSLLWARSGPALRMRLLYLARVGLAAASIAAIWHAYYFAEFGSVFPDTLKAKILQGRSGDWGLYADHVWPRVEELLAGRSYLLPVALVGLIRQPLLSLHVGGFTALHYLVYRGLGVPNYHWYYYDFYLLILLSLLFGFFRVVEALFAWLHRFRGVGGREAPSWLPQAIAVALVLGLFPMDWHAPFLRNPVVSHGGAAARLHRQSDRYLTYSRMARRLADEIAPGDVVLAPEIGILSHFLKDAEIRDVVGLASPVATAGRINDLDFFLDLYQPRFFVDPRGTGYPVRSGRSAATRASYVLHFIASPQSAMFPGYVYVRLMPEAPVRGGGG